MALEELDERERQHLFEGEPDEDLVESLEPDQLVTAMERPLRVRHFGLPARAGFWLLRLYVLALAAAVVYIFVLNLAR